MLKKIECYKARSEVTAFSILKNNTLALSTNLHGVKIFSLEECSSIKNLSIELLGYKTTATVFSYDEALLAFANNNIIYIINTQNKLLLQTIKTFEGEITLIEFIPNSKYIITGTKNGRVMQYRYDGRSHLSRLCSFGQDSIATLKKLKNNYVSAFAFHENIFASTGYGGVITILKMNSYTNRYNINASKVQISALCFLDKARLVSGSVDGIIKIHSLKKYTATTSIATQFTDIKNIILMPNPRFIMVSAASNKLILIDTHIAKVVNNSYLEFKENVSKVLLSKDNHLLVLLESQEFFKVELPTSEHIKSFILHNSLDKAYKLIEENPMLQGTREHKRVEVMYEKQYAQAIEALINSNTKEARKLMRMFSDIPSKKDDIKAIFRAFEYYPRFKSLYLDKKYALAYAMAEKHPALKYTKQFKKMEESFKETFTFAQKQMIIGREDVAKEILSPYSIVLCKKPLLNLVLKQNKDFIEFLKAINNKNYALVDQLVKKNTIFKTIPNYIEFQNQIEKKLKSIKSDINNAEIDQAVDKIKDLINVSQFKERLQELYKDAKLVEKLQITYQANDFTHCYEIIDSAEDIEELELSQLLEKHWSKLMDESEEFALKGDLKGIKKTLGPLLFVKTRVDKIGDLIRLSFHIKIKGLMAKKSFKSAESIIYTYIDIFGKDSEITLIMRTYEKVLHKKLAITQNQQRIIPRDNWLRSSLIME